MDRIDTDALINSIDLTTLAGRYTTLRGNGEQYGPCPKCEGRDRFHVPPTGFFAAGATRAGTIVSSLPNG